MLHSCTLLQNCLKTGHKVSSLSTPFSFHPVSVAPHHNSLILIEGEVFLLRVMSGSVCEAPTVTEGKGPGFSQPSTSYWHRADVDCPKLHPYTLLLFGRSHPHTFCSIMSKILVNSCSKSVNKQGGDYPIFTYLWCPHVHTSYHISKQMAEQLMPMQKTEMDVIYFQNHTQLKSQQHSQHFWSLIDQETTTTFTKLPLKHLLYLDLQYISLWTFSDMNMIKSKLHAEILTCKWLHKREPKCMHISLWIIYWINALSVS